MLYEQIEKMSLPLIQDYHNDLLVHDKRSLEQNHGIPFIHFTRKLGTHLFFMRPADSDAWPRKGEMIEYVFGHADREHILQDTAKCIVYAANDDCRLCLHYDGKKLRKIDPERAIELATTWQRKVENAWRK